MNPQSFRTRLVMLLLLVLIPAAVLLLLVNPIIEGTTPVLSVQVVAPKKALFATADSEFVGSLIGILLIGLLVLRMAWWYSKRAFLRPFGAMLAATDRISNGDLTARTG